jgi:glucose dehydrogenase
VPRQFMLALFLLAASVTGALAQTPPVAAAPAEDGQWTMPAKNYASTRSSELSQINRGNVGSLKVAFTFSTGVNRGQESAPLAVGGTMFLVTPYPTSSTRST